MEEGKYTYGIIKLFKCYSIDIISEIRKEFYKKVIEEKYNKILIVAYKKVSKNKT